MNTQITTDSLTHGALSLPNPGQVDPKLREALANALGSPCLQSEQWVSVFPAAERTAGQLKSQ